MFYFINENIFSRNSSIEHAEFKRLDLFKQFKTAAQIVVRNHDNQLHRTIKKFNLTDDDIVNMFDFFGGTINLPMNSLKVKDLNLPIDYKVSGGVNSREITDGGRQVGEVFFAGGTVGLVSRVDYFDPAGNLVHREQYDIRGFKSVDEFFDDTGNLFYQIYYRPDQTRYLERHYVKSTANTPINSLNRLIDYRGRDRFFNSLDEMYRYFLDELNLANGEKNAFIADRPLVANQPMMEMQTKSKKYLWLPINHALNGQDEVAGAYDGTYAHVFSPDELKKVDGIITMTTAQAKILKQRLPKFAKKIFSISGAIAQSYEQIPLADRRKGKIIYVGRLGDDKQIEQLLQAYQLIQAKIPDATLAIYGYGNQNDEKRYQQQAEQLKITDRVTFAGYYPDTSTVYDDAQLMIDLGQKDGQPLAMVEAMSHGVPVISYDYKFGPQEIIEDGKNGQLIPAGELDQLVKAAINLLRYDKKWQTMSDQAYQISESYGTDAVWQQWKKIVK